MFKKAERKAAKLRIAIMGTSGTGKTYSALQIGKGLGGKVALLDTERGSGSLYAHVADYDVAEVSAPFAPEKYIQVIKAAEQAGYTTLIIDSLSHAWAGEGGMLDMQDKAAKSSRSGNSYMAWREVTPHHNKLVDAILQSKMHIILTLRTKTAYEVQDDGRGKKVPVKIGLAPVFRDGIEYESTVVLDISTDHIATASKDRTGLFTSPFQPTVETGQGLLAWLEQAPAAEEEPPAFQPAQADPIPPQPSPAPAVSPAAPQAPATESAPAPVPGPKTDMISEAQTRKIHVEARRLGQDRDELLARTNAWLKSTNRKEVASISELDKWAASGLIDAMTKAQPTVDPVPA